MKLLSLADAGLMLATAGQSEVERQFAQALWLHPEVDFTLIARGKREDIQRLKNYYKNRSISFKINEGTERTLSEKAEHADGVFLHNRPDTIVKYDLLNIAPCMMHIHSLEGLGQEKKWYGKVNNYLPSRYPIAVISPSECTARRFTSLTGNIPVVILPHEINTSQTNHSGRELLRRSLNLTDSTRLLVSFNRISRYKCDYEQLIRVFAQLIQIFREKENLHLLIAGGMSAIEEDYFNNLKKLVASLGIESYISFFPRVDEKEKQSFFAAADIFLSLATNTQESFGLVLLEAMNAGLPIIATDWNGYPTTLPKSYNKYLVSTIASHTLANKKESKSKERNKISHAATADYYSLLSTCRRFVNDRDLCRFLTHEGIQFTKGRSWEKYVENYLSSWSKLLKGKIKIPNSPPLISAVDNMATAILEENPILYKNPDVALHEEPSKLSNLLFENDITLPASVDQLTQLEKFSFASVLELIRIGYLTIEKTPDEENNVLDNSEELQFYYHTKRPSHFRCGPLLHSTADLGCRNAVFEKAKRIKGARLIYADVPLLKRDFPKLSSHSNNEVKAWLLKNAAIISLGQLKPSIVNSKIEIHKKNIEVIRPPRYGRSLVRPVFDNSNSHIGLLDIKGCGIANNSSPKNTLHGTGLMQLGEAIQDSVVQWIIESILLKSGSSYTALPLYGLIDPGFDVITTDGRMVRAGIQVRRAHRRAPGGVELPLIGSELSLMKAEVELLLRKFGITSANQGTLMKVRSKNNNISLTYGGQDLPVSKNDGVYLRLILNIPEDWEGEYHYDGINVQFTYTDHDKEVPAIVDFGQYSLHDQFHFGVLNLVRDQPFLIGGTMRRSHPNYVQASEELRISKDLWPSGKSWKLADKLRDFKITHKEIRKEMRILQRRLTNG